MISEQAVCVGVEDKEEMGLSVYCIYMVMCVCECVRCIHGVVR